MIRRLIKIETTVLMDFPEDWNDDEITFYLNDSSHCAINELAKLDHSDDTECGCACTTFTVVCYPTDEQMFAHQFIDIREPATESEPAASAKL